MTYILLLVIAISVYIGNVVGCLVLCETIPELSRAKKFVWQVPIINLSYVVYILFSSKMAGRRFQALLLHLKTPCKNVLVIYAMIETAKEIAVEKKRNNNHQSNKYTAQRFFKNSIEEYGRAIVMSVPYV